MYLIFKLHKLGFPVNDIYEQEVKPISTRRFNNENIGSGVTTFEAMTPEQIPQESFLIFDSEASYDNINLQVVDIKPKPDFVPGLNLFGLPEYESSEDEDEEGY